MAQPFVLDINLQIQKVLGLDSVKQQLSSVAGSSAQVNVGAQGAAQTATALGNTQAAAVGAAQAINNVAAAQTKTVASTAASNAAIKSGAGLFDNYGSRVALAGARYSAFLVATSVPFAGLAIIGEATQSIIQLDEAMVKLSQILRQPKEDINALREEIIRLSVDTGTSIKDISDSALVLAQAGFLEGPQDFAKFLEPLSKIPLLPTFGSIEEATEGVIAGLNQFADAGLEPIDILDKMTRVADQFAVESDDLVQALTRAGGTFSALGGDIDQFFAVFTTLRSTTRESAESIATALKTITTRLAEPITVSFLENLGVTVRDNKGELLDLIDIFKNVAVVFNQSSREQQAAIGKQLGGLRNIGRVFAGLSNTDLTDQVLAVSRASGGAVAESAAKGLEKISTQIDLLVARFNELAQSLAEPVFVPFIEGALAVGNAIVTVIDVIKPVLPLFVELIALAAGLKVFSVAATSITKLGGALAAINLGGLSGIGGGGLARGAGSFAGAGQNVIPIGGVGATTSRGSNLSGLAGSQGGQLAGLLGLNLIASKLSESFEKTDNSVAKLGLGALQTSTTLLGLASIITGKSISDLFKGLGAVGKTLVGVGALFAITGAVSDQNQINIDELVTKAAKEVNSLDVQITSGSEASLQNAISQVTTPLVSAISDISDTFDPSTFRGAFSAFSERISDLFSGDFTDAFGLNLSDTVKGNVTLSNDDIDKFTKEIVGDNPKVLGDIVKESLTQFGTDFQEGLQGQIEATLEPFKDVVDVKALAGKIRERIIESVGGLKVIGDLRVQAQQDAANKLLAESTKKIANDLRSIILPQSLNAELIKLSETVRLTVQSIDSSIGSFDSLTSTIGKIETPQLSTTVTPEAARRAIESGNVDLGGGFDQLDTAAQKILITQRAIEDFSKSLQLNLGNLEQQFGAGAINPNEIINNFIESFLANVQGLPPEAEQAIRSSAGLIASDLEQSIVDSKFGIEPDRLKGAINTALGGFGEVTDQLVEQVQSLIEAQLRLANAQNKARDFESQIITTESVRPETILDNLSETLERIGITGVSASNDLDTTVGAINRVSQSVEIAKLLFEEFGPALQERNQIEAKLREATLENASNVGELTAEYIESSNKVRDIKEAFAEVGKLSDLAASRVGQFGDEIDEFQTKQVRDEGDITKEIIGLAAKLTEFDAAADSSKIFESATSKFSNAVDKFTSTTVGGTVTPTRESDARFLPTNNIETLPQITSEVQEIFQSQLENQRSFTQNISDAGTAIGLFSQLISDSVFGTQLLDDAANTTRAPFDPSQFQQAINDTLQQISRNNLTNPDLSTNPLAFLGSNIEDIKKGLKLTLDQETQSKLLINLSPEAINALKPLTDPLASPSQIPLPSLIDSDLDTQSSSADFLEATNSFASASDLFGSVIVNLQSLIDQAKITPTSVDTAVAQAQQESPANDFIKTIGEKISELVAIVQSQAETQEQVATDQKPSEIKIDGLENVEEATSKNSEALASNNDNLSSLTDQLSKTEDALAKGVNLNLETIQNVNVNVAGVSEEIEGVGARLELVARDIARSLILGVLDDLERSAQDTNTAIAFNNAKNTLT